MTCIQTEIVNDRGEIYVTIGSILTRRTWDVDGITLFSIEAAVSIVNKTVVLA